MKTAVKKINPLILRRRAQGAAVSLVRALFLLGLCYLFLFPIFYLLLTAFATPDSMINPNVVWIPGEFTLDNVKASLERLEFSDSALISLKNTILGTAASLVSCALIGYGFARYNFAEKGVMWMLLLLTIIVPPQTMLITQFLQYRSFDFGGILSLFGVEGLNLLNSSWVFFLPALFGCGLRNGLFIFIFRQFFLGLPKDLEEAAWVDGCNPLMTFIKIIIPSAGPGILTVTLFSFVWHWNDFYYSDMLYNEKLKPLIPMMETAKTKLQFDLQVAGDTALDSRGILAAAGLMTIVVPLVLYLFLQRYFVESIERTGIVG